VSTFILTWNQDKWDYDPGERERLVEQTLAGHHVPDRWSTGNRSGGILPGDRLFLLKQGEDRGVVAAGYAIDVVDQDSHWDGSGRLANFVTLRWELVLPISDRIDIDDLRAGVPGVTWDRLQASGVEVESGPAQDLSDLWSVATEGYLTGLSDADVDLVADENEIARIVSPSHRGQGPSPDPIRRKAVEEHAMRVASECFNDDGWDVIDVSATMPYDLECSRADERLLVEVKGTTGDGSVVLLTANEVNLARETPNTALAIVSEIVITGKGSRTRASGGRLRLIQPWTPSPRRLEATAYRYRV